MQLPQHPLRQVVYGTRPNIREEDFCMYNISVRYFLFPSSSGKYPLGSLAADELPDKEVVFVEEGKKE